MTDMLQLDVHSFGSQQGYRMLAASPGVSEAELASLDPMTSGVAEVGPSAEVASRAMSMLVRTLPGGRIAVTRWFTGAQDDAGRPTVELRSILFSPQDWQAHGRRMARHLIEPHDVWDSAAFGTGASVNLAVPNGPSTPTERDVFRLADLVRPGAMPLRLVDDRPMREALFGLVEHMCPEEALHLQWGVGLSHVARGLDIMTLTRGGLIETLDHSWRRDDLRDATGIDVPSLTAPAAIGIEPEAASPVTGEPENAGTSWRPARRRRNIAPLVAAGLAVIVIVAVLWLTQRQETSAPGQAASSSGSSSVVAKSKPVVPLARDQVGVSKPSAVDVEQPPAGLGGRGGGTGFEPSADAPPMEDKPLEDKPVVEDKPLEDKPAVEDKPLEGKPVVEDKPLEDKPAVEDKPLEDKPAVETSSPPTGPLSGDGGGAAKVISAAEDPHGVRMRVEAIAAKLMSFSPGALLKEMGQATDAWSLAIEPDEAVQVLRDTFCHRLRDRVDLTRWENELLDPSLLGVWWGLSPIEHWIRNNTLGDEDSDHQLEILNTARARVRSLDDLIAAVQDALAVEKALARNDKAAKRYPEKALAWLSAHASNCLPAGTESMSVELFRNWHADSSRLQQLERVGRGLQASRNRLSQWLKETDPHGKHP